MPEALAIAFPLTLAGVLIASGVSKFRAADDLAAWAELGVPAPLRREWLRRLHPWGEVALGLAIAVVGGAPALVAALAAAALMAAYTWLVVRAVREEKDASCACFGARKRVTKVTIVRNVWLTALAVVTSASSWTTPLIGGPLREAIGEGPWVFGLVVAAITTALILWPERGFEVPPANLRVSAGEDGEDGDYVRTRTPAVPVTFADGRVENLRTLAARKPILLLSVSPTCAPCAPVIEKVGFWRDLLPEVDVRLLLAAAPEDSALIETAEPQSLHDPDGYARQSLDIPSTPTAVLLGADGLLAGGPAVGADDIDDFVADIYESLHGERPQTASTAADHHS
ncbi:hypothetical protein Q9S36_40485 [Microbacterium sp. ARD31]|uniref:MauE/DoxX family redox-associated membrane protein n=1 Tax=Microbacterium sp. ARD31 TaxID=2962576 RepID=UPI0028819A17|nr:MauE/DoxX family redox-associated membrane protein [Microbacterium sp. ARD31]MDT0186481.1 hypothetical protein [Microbacterium sp. ARD31]